MKSRHGLHNISTDIHTVTFGEPAEKTNTRWHSWPTSEENNYASIWLSKSGTVQRRDSHRARRRPQQGHYRRTRLKRLVNLHCFPSMSAMQQVLSAAFRCQTRVVSIQPECVPASGSWRRSKETQATRTMGTTSVRDATMMTWREKYSSSGRRSSMSCNSSKQFAGAGEWGIDLLAGMLLGSPIKKNRSRVVVFPLM